MSLGKINYKKFVDFEINKLSDKEFSSIYNISSRMFFKENLTSLFNEKKKWYSSKSNSLYLIYSGKEVVGYLKGYKKRKTFYIDWIGVDEEYRRHKLGTKLQIRVLADLKRSGIKSIVSKRHILEMKDLFTNIVNRNGVIHYRLKTTESKKRSYSHSFKSIIKVRKRK